jgi:hypothetical protein
MRFESFSFGPIRIDGVTYEHGVVIDRGEVRRRLSPWCGAIKYTIAYKLTSSPASGSG